MTHLVSIERAYLFYTKRNVFVPGREKKNLSRRQVQAAKRNAELAV
jgi:hypothetical protein